MVSIWWVALAFVLGGLAGLLIYAFMAMSARQDERSAMADEDLQRKLQRKHLAKVSLEEHWST